MNILDWLEGMPAGVQIGLLLLSNMVSALAGGRLQSHSATSRITKDLAGAYSTALHDMQERIDYLSNEVEKCERGRAEDRELHRKEIAAARVEYAGKNGELQGQIDMLEKMLRGRPS